MYVNSPGGSVTAGMSLPREVSFGGSFLYSLVFKDMVLG